MHQLSKHLIEKIEEFTTKKLSAAVDLAIIYEHDELVEQLNLATDEGNLERVNLLLDAIALDKKYWDFMNNLPVEVVKDLYDYAKTQKSTTEK